MSSNRRLLWFSPIVTGILSVCLLNVLASSRRIELPVSEIDACFSALLQFDYGKESAPLYKLSAYVESLEAGSDGAKELEFRFIALLQSKASPAAKQFACRQLGLIGGDASLPALERLLGEDVARESALYALERIPGSGSVLREALAKSKGTARTAVIGALGRRRYPEDVELLKTIVREKDAAAGEAAIRALGSIGTADAAEALRETRRSSSGEARRLVGFSLLECGERLASVGQAAEAARIFRDLNTPADARELRFGALRGLTLLGDKSVVPDLLAFIKKEEPKAAANAIGLLLGMRGLTPVQALTDVIPALKPATQAAAMLALADHVDGTAALSTIVEASRSDSSEVRTGAWTALARWGDSSHVPSLVKALLAPDASERAAARLGLSRMTCPGFDSVLLDLLEKARPDGKIEIVGIIDERRMAAAADSLIPMVKGGERKLRGAALKALRKTASEPQIRPLVDLLSFSWDATEGAALAETIASLLARFPQPHVEYVCQSYRAATDAAHRARLAAALKGVGGAQALSLLKQAMISREPEIRRAAVLSLSYWPNANPVPDLLSFAGQTMVDRSLRTLALRGCMQLVSLPAGRNHAESVRLIKQVFDLAPVAEEKKAALALLDRFPSPQAFQLAQAAMEDPAVSAEAKTALERLRETAAGQARLLVYTRNYSSRGEIYVHDNIASAVEAIKELGRNNGFGIDLSDQPSVFTDENLANYQAVVFCNSNGEAFENDEQRAVFVRYIRHGGGFVGIHAASACEPDWQWFRALIGATFDFHPPLQPFTIRVLDKNHPSTDFFEEDTWQWEDEFYFLKHRNEKVRVLLAGDLKSLRNPGDYTGRITSQPDPCPLAWSHEFEGGRSWYTALGHSREHYQDRVYLKHLLGGILWAIGRK
ncbi:MAG: hypothetical protein EHM23_22775 [Acidobacteria bacterium]|nr:MAG: hypothetical protein EHM23_22775 [Acidobacteriota bacterium]